MLKISKKRKPKFRRQFSKQKRRIDKKSYRNPKGAYSKTHLNIKGKNAMPNIGYREHKAIRGLHPSGLKEVLVRHVTDFNDLDPNSYALMLSSTLGARKRAGLVKTAKGAGFKILNE
jgi:large subunit ribosomal protein L32e